MDPLIGIIMGSKSDLPVMQAAARVLDELGLRYEMTVVSAHRHSCARWGKECGNTGCTNCRLS